MKAEGGGGGGGRSSSGAGGGQGEDKQYNAPHPILFHKPSNNIFLGDKKVQTYSHTPKPKPPQKNPF